MATRIPHHIAAAAELLAVQPRDHILEIGCGNGTAAALVCERLTDGRLAAIDRSETQIGLASKRNRAHVESGRLTLAVMALESATLGDAQFDKIYAINVNCFWLRSEKPLDAVIHLLKPDGAFSLFYRPPASARLREISSVLCKNLGRAGFAITQEAATADVYWLASTLLASDGP